jgi:hypothetical protein
MTAPDRLEREMLAKYPDLDERISRSLNADGPRWPSWCYLPMADSYSIVTAAAEERVAMYLMTAAERMYDMRRLAAIIPWRVAKPIYRFDADLAAELMTGAGDSRIPAQVLMRLPYPCIFIEHPPGVDDCEGVFAFLEADERYPEALELRLHYLFSDGRMQIAYIQYDLAGRDSSVFAARQAAEYAKSMRRLGGRTLDSDDGPDAGRRADQIDAHKYGHINMLLYLCADEPDLRRSAPVPRQRGPRIDVAAYSDVIDVGTAQGVIIRRARQVVESHTASAPAGTHKSPTPHVRRAHWHLYWMGTGRTTPAIKWIMPIFVGGGDKPRPTTINIIKE